jgi:myo-inositol-1(or 4)-monophosphatase
VTEVEPRDPGELAALAALAQEVAAEAGRLLLHDRPRHMHVGTKSTPTDVVTEMDTRAEALLVSRIRAERPDDGVLGEEGSSDLGRSGVRWVIDPVDGTVNYLYELPVWAVSVAVEVDGVVQVGVVEAPALGERFVAVRGAGAIRNGEPVHASSCTELDQALVATGFGYDAGRRAHQAAVVAAVLPVVRDIRRLGASSLDLCGVACGRVDGYFERGLQPWDLAAGTLVATEAGAVVGGLRGRPASGELVVAAAPGVFDALHDLLLPLGADVDGVDATALS